MSLAIDVDLVERVLLADGWHPVLNESFSIDSYEFIWTDEGADQLLHGGGTNGVCASGFLFEELTGKWLSGPLTAILAVQTER